MQFILYNINLYNNEVFEKELSNKINNANILENNYIIKEDIIYLNYILDFNTLEILESLNKFIEDLNINLKKKSIMIK